MNIPEPSPPEFRRLLRQHRLAAGLTQEGLAERSGLSVRGLSDLERGARAVPRNDTLELLAVALGLVGSDRFAFEAAARQRLVATISRVSRRPGRPPLPLTSLVGREREITAMLELLRRDGVRLVTLTGPGGAGKTRLALRMAEELADDFAGSVWFVDLASLADPALVPTAIAGVLGIRETNGRPLTDRLQAFLQKRHLLLILDNFERVTVAAPLIAALLSSCPGLHVLVTSRVSLHLSGEHQFPVPPLILPDSGHPYAFAEVAGTEAVRLFVMRANAIKPNFELTEDNVAAVAEVCRRLDGLPLGIELAAARVRHLSPSALLIRLERRLELLTGGVRDQPARLQSMRETIAWSYDLLPATEQRLFRHMAVFVGGFTLEAVADVCEKRERESEERHPEEGVASAPSLPAVQHSVLDGIASLIDKSLLKPEEGQSTAEPRFGILETIREYGLEQLEDSGEAAAVRERHAAWCLGLVETAEAERTGLIPSSNTDPLGPEQDNLRAALNWLRDHGRANWGLRLASALWPLWLDRSQLIEGRDILTAMLSLPGASADKPVWAKAMCVTGALVQALGDHDRAAELSKQALAIFQHLGDPRGEAFALNTLGLDAMSQGNYAESENLLQESLARFRMVGDSRAGAWALRHLSSLAYRHGNVGRAAILANEGLTVVQQTANRFDTARLLLNVSLMAIVQLDLARAETLSQRALTLFREEGDRWGEAYALIRLGQVARARSDLVQAATYMDESLTRLRDVGDLEGTAVVLVLLGWIKRAQGAQVTATRHFAEGLALCRERHHPSGVASALLGEVALALDRSDPHAAGVAWEESLRIATKLDDRLIIAMALEWSSHFTTPGTARMTARVLGAASTLRDGLGIPLGAPMLAEHEQIMQGLQDQLGEQSYDATVKEGRSLPLDEAIALSADLVGSTASMSNPVAPIYATSPSLGLIPDRQLTPRELEVLRLLAEGRSDRDIAGALSISPRTVGGHVTHLLAKLGVETRTAAVAHALRNGLA